MHDDKDLNMTSPVEMPESTDIDSSIHADEEGARLDFAEMFSTNFSNITPLYSSPRGATEIHVATRYGKRFVLKGLKSSQHDDPIQNMCMAKEFEIGMSIDHPNIRRTLGLESVEGLGKRIVLEYIDGAPLSEIIGGGHLSPERAEEIATQTADALEYLHSKQIFHRDLKPDNILIPYHGGNVKVIDFNLSDSDDYVILKNPAGSQRYMAPEQGNLNSKPSADSDWYSLGVVMKELAEVSGSTLLLKAATASTSINPAKRYEGIRILRGENLHGREAGSSPADTILASKTLTYILTGMCIALTTFIAHHYIYLNQ